MPDSSNKTLLDQQLTCVDVSWTYEDLLRFPLAVYAVPETTWKLSVQPTVDGQNYARSSWSRVDGYLPALSSIYRDFRGTVRLEMFGCESAMVARIQVANTGEREHTFSLLCEMPAPFGHGYSPAWVDSEKTGDHLLAGWSDRADRVLLLGLGAQDYPVTKGNRLEMAWTLGSGAEASGWLVRPYAAYASDLEDLRVTDWSREVQEFFSTWNGLLDRASVMHVPDVDVDNGFKACLADLFVMREPVADGYIAATPGTECYRAANAGEASITAIALDQMGLHDESALGFRMCLDQQGDDGDWADPKGWSHLFSSTSGFKSWAAMEHYRLTGSRDFLEQVYPRMLASSRFQERSRFKTRKLINGERTAEYGLMPRGQGDCGLMNDDDFYGVYLPHNLWSVSADRISVEAAEILGKVDDLPELRRIYETALGDLCQALEMGSIQEDGYRWIPGVAGKSIGSRWGALNALYPCRILGSDDDLVTGTIRHIESNMGPGGIPLHLGWGAETLWVAIALDNLAEVHLVRGNGDAAAEYLYAAFNHGTPLFTWCEERGYQPGSDLCTGDRQHLWTPVSVVRVVRDMLVMENGSELHLAKGTARSWLSSGGEVGVTNAPTHFGKISYSMHYDQAPGTVSGRLALPDGPSIECVRLFVRLNNGFTVKSVDRESGAIVSADGLGIEWAMPRGEVAFRAIVS